MRMQSKTRFSLAIAFLFLFSIALVSCSTQEIKPAEESRPAVVSTEPQTPDGEAKEKAALKEADVDSEKKTGPESVIESKETGIDPQVQSQIRSLESEPIFFEFDRSELSPEAQAVLKKLADWLKKNNFFSVLIEGHCDERGPSGYNIVLGQNRAVAAEKYLQLLGIEADRISTLSYGEEMPAVAGNNEEVWRRNRRGQFKLKANR